jgi:hypothetical protein
VPGHPLDPRAEGTNKLLKSGATLVTEASDLLSALTPLTDRPPMHLKDGEPGAPVSSPPPADLSDPAPVEVDALVRGTGLASRAVQGSCGWPLGLSDRRTVLDPPARGRRSARGLHQGDPEDRGAGLVGELLQLPDDVVDVVEGVAVAGSLFVRSRLVRAANHRSDSMC